MLDVVYMAEYSDNEDKKYYVYDSGELVGRILYGNDSYYDYKKGCRVQDTTYKYEYLDDYRGFDNKPRFGYASDTMRGFSTLAAARYAMTEDMKKKEKTKKATKTDVKFLPKYDENFYPTPSKLVGIMLKGIKRHSSIVSVLECSAGKGNIVDCCREYCESTRYKDYNKYNDSKFYGFSDKVEYDCIEIDEDLRKILVGKGYRVVYDDFLRFSTTKKYDLLMLNPPFSEGATHLLKALDVQSAGGQICCILNAETLRNPYTAERKELINRLSKANATYKFIKGAFLHSERPSDVEVAVVWVDIPKQINGSFILDDVERAEKIKVNVTEPTDIVFGGVIDGLIASFNKEREIIVKFVNEYVSIIPYIMKSYDVSKYDSPILELKVGDYDNFSESKDYNEGLNKALKKLRSKYWNKLLHHKELTAKFTSRIRNSFDSIVRDMADYDFDDYNIKSVLAKLNVEMFNGVQSEIENLFSELTAEHSYYGECSCNVHYYSGWVTNKAYKVNEKKVIMPVYAYDNIWNRIDKYKSYQFLSDIERVFNYLDGKATLGVDLQSSLESCINRGVTKNIPCKYFDVTFYKKGTAHLVWNEDGKRIVDTLNIHIGKMRSWLPFDYGKKAYHSMSDEEKALVNEFQGKDEYNKVYCNNSLYLYEPNKNNLLQLAVNE